MPPEERRAAIIAAARPLLLSHGARFTTREVAEAAGIAEGTIFRVFASKTELLHAVISSVLDPTEICAELDQIDRSLPLDDTVVAAVSAIVRAVGETSAIFAALHSMPADDIRLDHKPDLISTGEGDLPRTPTVNDHHGHDAQARRASMLDAAIIRVLTPHSDQLSIALEDASSLLRSTTLAVCHPFFSDGRLSEPSRLAHILVHGIAKDPTC